MIKVQVAGPNLEVEVTGLDSVLVANRGRWTFSAPIGNVLQARVAPPRGFGQRRHVNAPGSDRARYGGRLICAHFRAPVLCIELDTYPYHKLILSVPGPADAAAQIQRAVAAGGR